MAGRNGRESAFFPLSAGRLSDRVAQSDNPFPPKDSAMKRTLLLLIFCMVLTRPAAGLAGYCNPGQWQMLTSPAEITLDSYNLAVHVYNKYLDFYQKSDFIFNMDNRLTEARAAFLKNTESSVKKYVQAHREIKWAVQELDRAVGWLEKIIDTRAPKRIEEWEEMAEACDDDDIYEDYEGALDNIRIFRNLISRSKGFLVEVKELRSNLLSCQRTIETAQIEAKSWKN